MKCDRAEPIAVIGIGLRFPGADDPGAFWELLRAGREAVGRIPARRWDERGQEASRGPYCSGLVPNIDAFDWRAFGIAPRELKQVDPQHRLLLETAWEALEDAGLPLANLRGSRTGVFIGINFIDYMRMVARNWSKMDGYTLLGTTAAMAANRISYTFDLRGESTAVSVGCASALVALHHACRSLHDGETEMALAGGVELMLSPDSTRMLAQAGVLSAAGRCRSLSARADGYVRGEGAGVVVLKLLRNVAADDRVYAVISGSAVNHNGHNEWIMAASDQAQAGVLRAACAKAGLAPTKITYVELHGSALPKGDLTEARAVGAAVGGEGRRSPCRIGTVTNNIGYLGAAGGVAGLIKTALSFYHRQLPATINLEQLNPAIPFAALGLQPQQKLEPWRDEDEPRLAGVLATSLGGANAAVVLAAAPETSSVPARQDETELMILPLSAHTRGSLHQRIRDMREFLVRSAEDVHDICYTASVRRSHHQHRAAVTGRTREDLVRALDQWLVRPEAAVDFDLPLAERYRRGDEVDWKACHPRGKCVSLPIYPFERERFWPEWLTVGEICTPLEPLAAPRTEPAADAAYDGGLSRPPRQTDSVSTYPLLLDFICASISELLESNCVQAPKPAHTFLGLGLNSLLLMELRTRLQSHLQLSLQVTLFFEYPTIEAFTRHLLTKINGDASAGLCEEGRPTGSAAGLIDEIECLSEEEAEARILKQFAALETSRKAPGTRRDTGA